MLKVLQKVLQSSHLNRIFLREGLRNANNRELLVKDLDGSLCQLSKYQLSKQYLQVVV
jgi:hypothetical protein